MLPWQFAFRNALVDIGGNDGVRRNAHARK